MKLTFLGAAREVTGSCYRLELNGKNYLIDCGMEQGPNIYENETLAIKPKDVDGIFLTHAHIDHSGNLPTMVKHGYKNNVYMTKATAELCKIMLYDSAKIQESEAEWRNRKYKRGSETPYEPLYTSKEVDKLLPLIVGVDYRNEIVIDEGLTATFIDAGHLLGSSSIKLKMTENGVTKTIVFSGDIGNSNKPILKNPEHYTSADYVVMESTYGDRLNGTGEDYARQLANIIDVTFANGGNVVIPTFAIGRMQELLYFLREVKEQGLVKRFPDFKVYVDSPLSVEATKIFSKGWIDCFDDEARSLLERGVNPIWFDGLMLSTTAEDSKAINMIDEPKVILSASGMCEAGRIRHHLKHNLWRAESAIVFVGYQVNGTLGRRLLDGERKVTLFGERIKVRANILQMKGTSSHADKVALVDWINHFEKKPEKVFVTHGEDLVAEGFAGLLSESGYDASAPYSGETWDLISLEMIKEGSKIKLTRTGRKTAKKNDLINFNVEKAISELNSVAEDVKEGTNEDKRKFIVAINRIIERFKKQ